MSSAVARSCLLAATAFLNSKTDALLIKAARKDRASYVRIDRGRLQAVARAIVRDLQARSDGAGESIEMKRISGRNTAAA